MTTTQPASAAETPRVRAGAGELVRCNLLAIVVVAVVLVVVSVVVVPAGWYLLAVVLLAPFAAACVVIDARTGRIPTVIVRTAAVVGLAMLSVAAVVGGDGVSLARAVGAAVGAGTVFFVKWWVAGTGMGDVRLVSVLALYAGWLGWAPALAAFTLPYLVAFPVAVARLVRGGRGDRIPFAPALVAGFYLAVLWWALLR